MKYRKKIDKKLVSILTMFSLISILIINAIPVSACHHSVGTFEEDFETPKVSFFKGETIYGLGQAFGFTYMLKLRIRDPDGNVVYYSNESRYVVNCSYLLNDSAKIGTWNIQLGVFIDGWQWTISSDRIAFFNVCDANFTLSVNVNGNGSVIKDPDQTTYSYGTVVNIFAEPDLGWSFDNWSGDLDSIINPEEIYMDSNKSVTANFVQNKYNLDIEIIGNGSVEIDPDLSNYTYGSVINLTAIANESWEFDHWEGDLSGNDNQTSIMIDDDKTIVAVFSLYEPEPLYTLIVNIDGEGVVNLNLSGPYHFGDIVNLTAVPAEGSIFDHWSGNLSGDSNPAQLNMTENKTVTAHFEIEDEKDENGGGNTGGGGTTTTSIPIKISNKAPVADLSAGELYIGFVDEDIDFDGTLSYDSDGYIIEWFWNFGDGTTAVGEIITHNYSSPGEYNVVLIVTDNKGARDSDITTAIIIQPNHPPSVPIVNGPTEGFIDIEYLFSIVSTDEDDDEIKYTVDWGDGMTNESVLLKSGVPFNVSHRWTQPGNYTISISAYDNDTIAEIDLTIDLIEQDVPEENNIIIIIIMILGLLLLLLFLILSRPQKDNKEEETEKKK